MQNANGDSCSCLPDAVALMKAPTHYSQAQLMIEDGIHRSVRYCVEALQRLVGIDGYTRCIAQQQQEKDVGIWRQRRYSLLHLLEGKIAVVGKLNSTCERLGCLFEDLLPNMFERRCAYYYRDIFCRGRNLQHVVNQVANLVCLPDVGRTVVQSARRQ